MQQGEGTHRHAHSLAALLPCWRYSHTQVDAVARHGKPPLLCLPVGLTAKPWGGRPSPSCLISKMQVSKRSCQACARTRSVASMKAVPSLLPCTGGVRVGAGRRGPRGRGRGGKRGDMATVPGAWPALRKRHGSGWAAQSFEACPRQAVKPCCHDTCLLAHRPPCTRGHALPYGGSPACAAWPRSRSPGSARRRPRAPTSRTPTLPSHPRPSYTHLGHIQALGRRLDLGQTERRHLCFSFRAAPAFFL